MSGKQQRTKPEATSCHHTNPWGTCLNICNSNTAASAHHSISTTEAVGFRNCTEKVAKDDQRNGKFLNKRGPHKTD